MNGIKHCTENKTCCSGFRKAQRHLYLPFIFQFLFQIGAVFPHFSLLVFLSDDLLSQLLYLLCKREYIDLDNMTPLDPESSTTI